MQRLFIGGGFGAVVCEREKGAFLQSDLIFRPDASIMVFVNFEALFVLPARWADRAQGDREERENP